MTGNPERVQLSAGTDSSSSARKPQVEFDLKEVMKPQAGFAQSKSVTDSHERLLADSIFGTLQILKNDAEAKVHAISHVASEVEHQALMVGEGALTGIALNPINGTTELVNHTLGTHIGEVQFKNQEEIDNSPAGKIGETLGSIADYAALSLGTAGIATVAGLSGAAADLVSLGAAGAFSGGFLSPSGTAESNKQFFQARVKGLLIGGMSSLLGVGAGELVSDATGSIENAVLRRSIAVGGGTVLGGAMSAGSTELASLAFTGKNADPSDLIWATSIGAFTGGISAIPEHLDLNLDEAAERQPSRFIARPVEREPALPKVSAKTSVTTSAKPFAKVSSKTSVKTSVKTSDGSSDDDQ